MGLHYSVKKPADCDTPRRHGCIPVYRHQLPNRDACFPISIMPDSLSFRTDLPFRRTRPGRHCADRQGRIPAPRRTAGSRHRLRQRSPGPGPAAGSGWRSTWKAFPETVVASFGAPPPEGFCSAGILCSNPSRSPTSCATATSGCSSLRLSASICWLRFCPNATIFARLSCSIPDKPLPPPAEACPTAPGATLAAENAGPTRVIDTDMVGHTGLYPAAPASPRASCSPTGIWWRGEKRRQLSAKRGGRRVVCRPAAFLRRRVQSATTAFHAGARVVLLNYLLPRDVLKALERSGSPDLPRFRRFTSSSPSSMAADITGTPALFRQYRRPHAAETLDALRRRVPRTKPYLMYGPTGGLSLHPTCRPKRWIGARFDRQAIPNAEILSCERQPCAANEPGEFSPGRWSEWVTGTMLTRRRSATSRYPPICPARGRPGPAELAVFSGDTVRRDDDGFLYFVGRRDEMIKPSATGSAHRGRRNSLCFRLVGECVAFSVDHPTLGQAIQVICNHCRCDGGWGGNPGGMPATHAGLHDSCRDRNPVRPLPRNPNGKIDRKTLSVQWLERNSG